MNDKIEWVLVPREPTEAMRRRGADRWIEANEEATTRKDEEESARCAWAAMLAAAPKPEAQAAGVDEDALIALVAGPYMWHHKMNEMQERYAEGFDRCRELTIEQIKVYCETRLAMKPALSTPASHDAQQPIGSRPGIPEACPKCNAPARYHAAKLGESSRYEYDPPAQQPAVVGDGVRALVDEIGAEAARLKKVDGAAVPDQLAEWADRLAALTPAATPGDGSGVECHKLDTPARVCFYEQDFYVLSNFSSFSLNWDGWRFDTSEAAYHYEKFKFFAPEVCDAVRAAPSAHEAFKVAERNKGRRNPEWDSIKISVMRAILREKVAQHEYVRRKLLATGDRELIEDSWRDDFWGWGPNRDGQNWLGRLWMEVRDELRNVAQKEGNGNG